MACEVRGLGRAPTAEDAHVPGELLVVEVLVRDEAHLKVLFGAAHLRIGGGEGGEDVRRARARRIITPLEENATRQVSGQCLGVDLATV